MKPDPLIQEIWKTKDDLAREAGYDVHRFFSELRKWSAEHGRTTIALTTADDLRRLVESAGSDDSPHAHVILSDDQPPSHKSE